MSATDSDYAGYIPDELDTPKVPQHVGPQVTSMEDIYNLLADIHATDRQILAILQALGNLINDAAESVPAALESLQDSPIFSMLSGGGGLLGSLFRR